jgi:hypothetical protein
VESVSDSIVFCYALPPVGTLADLEIAMTSVLSGVQMAWIAAIKEGYTIRGGADLGEMFWSDTETIGPGLVRAYLLESKIAEKSRVLIGPDFLANLLARMHRDWSEWPSSEWLSVSYDGLVEMSPHKLKNDTAISGTLHALQTKAGRSADKYDHILRILKDGFRKASADELAQARSLTLQRVFASVKQHGRSRERTR